jgi:peptide/nickel transport system permease protein
MTAWLIRRLFHFTLVMAVMSVLIYMLIGLMPGDPIDLMIAADPDMTPADAARLRTLYGLDLPLHVRYGNWLAALLQGDTGFSRLFGQPVPEVLLPALANTLKLLGLALFCSVAIAIPAGMAAGLRPRGMVDYGVNLLAFAGVSLPQFWLALLLIIAFAVQLQWLPAGGPPPPGSGWGEVVNHYILPVACITIASVGEHTRFVRASVIDVMRQDYIRTAQAKGAGPARLIGRHVLRNAMLPVITVLALDFGYLFSGALITETMFAWPGMGKLVFDAVMGNDFNLALIALLLITFVTLAGNLLADLAYALLDPRIRYQ